MPNPNPNPNPNPSPSPNPNPNQAVYLEGAAGGREGGAADTLVGRVVPADGEGAPAGAAAVADDEAYLYTEEFWVDGDEVDGVYSPRSSEPGL